MKKAAGKRSVSFRDPATDDEEAGAGLVVGLPVPGGPAMPARKRRSWVLAVAVPLALLAVATVATLGGVLAGQGGGLTEPAGRATLDREHVDDAVFLDFAADHPEFAPVGHAGRGYCGVSADGERALDSVVDFSGQVVPARGLPPQATFTAGEEIDLKFKLTDVALRDDGGRVEVGVCCKDPAGASDREMHACFDRHRHAAPLAPGARTTQIRAVRTEEVDADGVDGGAVEGSLRWRLPAAVAGERCLLQWRLFPANGATPALVDCADVTIRARPPPEDEDAAPEGVVGRPAANNGTELSADVLDTVPGDEWSSIAVADWEQCGGLNSLCQEDTACLSCESAGWTCQRGNEWWWQCRKEVAAAGPDATDSGETKPGQKPAAVGDWQACGGKNTAGCSADEGCFACASAAYRCRRDSEWYWQCRPRTGGRRNRLRA